MSARVNRIGVAKEGQDFCTHRYRQEIKKVIKELAHREGDQLL